VTLIILKTTNLFHSYSFTIQKNKIAQVKPSQAKPSSKNNNLLRKPLNKRWNNIGGEIRENKKVKSHSYGSNDILVPLLFIS
jgi:hypothetical protein